MSKTTPTLKTVLVDRCGPNEYWVKSVTLTGEIDDELCFDRRREAEQWAGKRARKNGCEWQSNY